MVLTSRKFRCYPDDNQAEILRQWEGSARFVYNAKQQDDEYAWWLRKHAILSPSWDGLNPMDDVDLGINQKTAYIKSDKTAFLRHVPSQVLRNAACQYMQAWLNFWKNPAHFGKPDIRKKYECGVLLTTELFRFEPDGRLWIGTKRSPVGYVKFNAYRKWDAPSQITIKEAADGSWWLCFSFEDKRDVVPMKPITVDSSVLGVDRGVMVPLALSDGQMMTMPVLQEKRLRRNQKRFKSLQRVLARQKRGSKRRLRTKRKLGRVSRKIRDSRLDFCHKASHALSVSGYEIISFENLKVKNMTKSAKGDVDHPGRHVAQKAGLNRSILDRGWGMLCRFTEYKCKRTGKHVRYESAAFSSQECAKCGYTHKYNRLTQAGFHCQACGHQANADTNAAEVIASRTKRWIILEFLGWGINSPPAVGNPRRKGRKLASSIGVYDSDAPTLFK